MTTVDKIFINLSVKDLPKTKEFFTALGLSFDPKFTNEKALCLVLGKNIFAMLLLEQIFKTFTKKEIVDAKKSTETLLAIHLGSRKEVDELFEKALAAGGKSYRTTDDHGWMYARTFEDLDGHQWELFFMDEKAMPSSPQ